MIREFEHNFATMNSKVEHGATDRGCSYPSRSHRGEILGTVELGPLNFSSIYQNIESVISKFKISCN